MPKKTEIANVRTVGHLDYTLADAAAAGQLGILVEASTADRITRAVLSYNMASRLAVEAGYLLLSVKAELAHGEFEAGVESMGLSRQRAAELMNMAKLCTRMPAEMRSELLNLPKTKVLALASADAEVVAELLEDGDLSDLGDLSVRGLRNKIKALQAQLVDAQVSADTALAEKSKLAKQLKRRAESSEDDYVPLAVADLRAEIAALVKKGQLAADSIHTLGREVADLGATAPEWAEPTARLALSGLLALREQIDGSLKAYAVLLQEDPAALKTTAPALAFLHATEIAAVAEDWNRLVAVHEHEAALRSYERKQARPKGKGRPMAEPTAPDAPSPKKSKKA